VKDFHWIRHERRHRAERRALQVVIVLGASIPISAGLYGALAGAAISGDVLSVSGDSHMRYLSGVLFAIGVGFLSTVPRIERSAARFRLLTGIVLTGGVFRLLALDTSHWPSAFMLGGQVMEVAVTPLLCLWQARIARQRTRAM
jgi:hypothetical protein